MAIIQLNVIKVINVRELSDVVDVLSQKGIEICYSVESDGVYLYGSESELAEVESIVWAGEVYEMSRVGETVRERI